ncbi:MAG: BamA/TamA family outer membrane protein [Bacteroidetes bacterium]|nr:BamA/TamA family outer membrane protein [Bacteroidota bacterium]
MFPATRKVYTLIIVSLTILASCSIPIIVKKPAAPFLRKNSIEVKGGNFTNREKSDLISRLTNQLEDSARVPGKDFLIFFNIIKRPPLYDSIYPFLSSENMRGTMYHIGYYGAKVSFKADTSNNKVSVKYVVDAGKPTRIDTLSYRLKKPDLQEIALRSKGQSVILKDHPITKADVMTEINRLVDSFTNNGYYKFTAAELKMRGDTTIEALTTITDDPFEQLRLLAEAQKQIDSPKIRLALVLNPPTDTSRLIKYYLRNITVLPDFRPTDSPFDTVHFTHRKTRNFIFRYRNPTVRLGYLIRNIPLQKGALYRERDFDQTINNLSASGVWERVGITTTEVPGKDSLDLNIELLPAKKLGFEAAIEASYSASIGSSIITGGNLFGLSGNLSLTNRNVRREAIRMTHKLRAGIELNNNSTGSSGFINSTEFSYNNNIVFPRLIPSIGKSGSRGRTYVNSRKGETYFNTNLQYTNRLNLFTLQAANFYAGWSWTNKKNLKILLKPLNLEFNYLNKTDSFNTILANNPFLKYSYNTAFVMGVSGGISKSYFNPWHPNSQQKERNINLHFEESGLTWANLGLLKKYLRRYIKFDAEYKYTITYQKTAIAFRLYGGVGIPLLGSDTNRTLPFFKQFIGGGSNSMRGWPIRGIGVGGQPLAPYKSGTLFNDRTGDMQLEGNIEYRYEIARIIPNTLTLRGALFVDAGNIWNVRNSKRDGSEDTAQFKIKNLYKQLGVSAGTGFRLDFNYFVLRLDLGFRFKRPELFYQHDGWKAPDIGFDDFLKKIFTRGANDAYRKWRYENFNFTIGIGVPF